MTNIPPKTLENYTTNTSRKVTSLNPNAAEFVPSALRSGNANAATSSRIESINPPVKVILDLSDTNISNNSDDEAQQYWHHQLPDDITPDFKSSAVENIPIAGLSIGDSIESQIYNASTTNDIFSTQQFESHIGNSNLKIRGNAGYSWDKKFTNGNQRLVKGIGVPHFDGDSNAGFAKSLFDEQTAIEDARIDPFGVLAAQFPGFSAESLADMYYANGCDLNFTVEMLSQLEIQEKGCSQNLNSKSFSVPSLSKLDISPYSSFEPHNGLSKHTQDLLQSPGSHGPTSSLFRTSAEFSLSSRKFSPIESGHFKMEKNGSSDLNSGPSRSLSQLSNSFNGHGKLFYGDKAPSPSTSRSAPIWLGTGEAEANIYGELREEARDLARFRDACLEQASQAFLIGDKSLARELSEKGHMYNLQMKAAQLKAGDTIYHKRDPIPYELQNYTRSSQDRLIDLHGLHISDALHVLKHEFTILKNAALASGHRLRVMISLGSGPHARSIHASPRLSMAVEQFLMEEGFPYMHRQPGLIRVFIY